MVKGVDTVTGRHVNWPLFLIAAIVALFIFLLLRILSPCIVVRWHTEVEVDSIGFNILRSDGEHVGFYRINDAPIPTIGSVTSGASYTFNDRSVWWGQRYTYRLQEISANGDVMTYPWRTSAQAQWPWSYLFVLIVVSLVAVGLFFVRGK